MFFRSYKFGYDAYQSVFAAFFGPDDERCKKERICGRSDQVCGAIQAAVAIRPDLEEVVMQEFAIRTSGVKCGDLLGKGQFCCCQCVNLACTILEDYQQKVELYKLKQWFEEVEDINKVFK